MLIYIITFLSLSVVVSIFLLFACMRSSQLSQAHGIMPNTEVFVSAERYQEGKRPLMASHSS